MKNILTDLAQTKAALIKALSAIPENWFNLIPFEGSWTAGQVAEHLLKANNVAVLYAETTQEDRAADEKTQAISDVFLNFALRLTPPPAIVPSSNQHYKQDMINELDALFDKLITAADTLNLNDVCLSWVIQAFGPLTRMEFLWLYNVHTIRHTRQLNNIAVALSAA